MIGVGLAGAFLGGVLTLLSPCSVMLLPAFFSYAFTSVGTMLSRTATFYLGLITTLVPLGLLAGTLGAFISTNRSVLIWGAACLVVLLGLIQVLGIPLPGLARSGASTDTSGPAVYLLGTVYGVAGVCAGPILGSVLTLAAASGSALYGGIVLLVYAAGMVVPLLLLALVWERLPGLAGWLRPRQLRIGTWTNTWTAVIGGVITIALGVLLLVTEGTLSLPGILDAGQQTGVEAQVLAGAGQLPDLLVVGIAVVVLGGTYLLHRRSKGRRPSA